MGILNIIIILAILIIAFFIIRLFFFRSQTEGYRPDRKQYSIDDEYNQQRKERQKELDVILDKINKGGMDSLSKSEKEKLNEYSKMLS